MTGGFNQSQKVVQIIFGHTKSWNRYSIDVYTHADISAYRCSYVYICMLYRYVMICAYVYIYIYRWIVSYISIHTCLKIRSVCVCVCVY